MDNAITDLLDAIIPKLGTMLSDMGLWMKLSVLIGPIVLMLLGAYYYFLPPKEANHKAGYRTYFGMGSVAAWKYTQKLAGMVWGILGAALTVAAIIICIVMAGQELEQTVMTGLVTLMVEVVGVIAGYASIEITVWRRFDADGNLRKK